MSCSDRLAVPMRQSSQQDMLVLLILSALTPEIARLSAANILIVLAARSGLQMTRSLTKLRGIQLYMGTKL